MKMIKLTIEQANQIKGKYGTYQELEPMITEDTNYYVLPIECINVNPLLAGYPQVEVEIITTGTMFEDYKRIIRIIE